MLKKYLEKDESMIDSLTQTVDNAILKDITMMSHTYKESPDKQKASKFFDDMLGLNLFSKEKTLNDILTMEETKVDNIILPISFSPSDGEVAYVDTEDEYYDNYTVENLVTFLYDIELNNILANRELEKKVRLASSCTQIDLTTEAHLAQYLDIDLEDYTEEKAIATFNKTSLLDPIGSYKKNVLSNIDKFSTVNILLFSKLLDSRLSLAKRISVLDPMTKLTKDFKNRAKGFKRDKYGTYRKTKGPTSLEVALYRFKEGNMIKCKDSTINRVINPKRYKDIEMNSGAKELNSFDEVHLLSGGRVMVLSTDEKSDRPAYGKIRDDVLTTKPLTVKNLKLDMSYLNTVLNTTIMDMKLESQICVNEAYIDGKSDMEDKKRNRIVQSSWNKVKNLYAIARQATLIASLLEGEENE